MDIERLTLCMVTAARKESEAHVKDSHVPPTLLVVSWWNLYENGVYTSYTLRF